MRILPVNFGENSADKGFFSKTQGVQPNSAETNSGTDAAAPVPAFRRNSLSDMDFNIISETIRCQNLKKQMNIRLMNLKRSLNKTAAKNLYNEL